ncbi:MAG: beta-glucosidase [Verrucomicrobia bacterium]|nr:beta-glucosidase [Verrucomicrobiota bacterium]
MPASPPLTFPRGFVWGVATAATQIEGAARRDGKGPSIWDTFAGRPGCVRHGETPEPACDHYRRFRSDFALMQRLGIRHYRLSVAWPRLFPEGRGRPNQKGIDFYCRLLDAMTAHGITPWVTMFHWDLPEALEAEGGWRVRATTDAFGAYADTLVRAFSPWVRHWITLNEIVCFTRYGHGGGDKAPGTRETEQVINQTYHHALLCHGHGVRAVREHGRRGARVGLADNPVVPIPFTETAEDIAAARAAFVAENIRVLDPIFRGRYAPAYLRAAGRDRPLVARGDLAQIALPTDFLGLNLYTGYFVRAGRKGKPERLPLPPGFPRADSPWLHLMPQALHWGPRHAHETYGATSLYVTENGAGYDEPDTCTEALPDLHRREYVRQCLAELHRAIAVGAPVRGYFLWSFMDNYEWQDGYGRRFGIVHVNFKTQRRTPKLSAAWYRAVMQSNRVV